MGLDRIKGIVDAGELSSPGKVSLMGVDSHPQEVQLGVDGELASE